MITWKLLCHNLDISFDSCPHAPLLCVCPFWSENVSPGEYIIMFIKIKANSHIHIHHIEKAPAHQAGPLSACPDVCSSSGPSKVQQSQAYHCLSFSQFSSCNRDTEKKQVKFCSLWIFENLTLLFLKSSRSLWSSGLTKCFFVFLGFGPLFFFTGIPCGSS